MKKDIYRKIQISLFVAMGILIVITLLFLGFTPNVETKQNRAATDYEVIDDVIYEEILDESAPIGLVRQFRFTVDSEIEYDTTLIFKFSHQNAEVYLDGEQIYTLNTAPALSIIKTPGINWAMIPLYREDVGKEVLVKLMPVYENYNMHNVKFVIGSKLAVYENQLLRSLPEMLLSLIDIFAGVLLLCVAFYVSVKEKKGESLFALALLAISLGLWNFTQTDFIPLMLHNKTIFVYYISLTMLMISVIPLIKSVRISDDKLSTRMLDEWCMVCGLIIVIQLVLQLLGIADLREMLKITHGMIVISSLVVIISSIVRWRSSKKFADAPKNSFIWILGVGVILDMFIYYTQDNAYGLFFVLITIICYVFIEGIQMFVVYIRQKQILEEKETQLTLSRITTMASQIRSHFVFNILNAISGMCKYDPEKADETIVRFARYLRNNIDIMEDDKPILFADELGRLEDYVVLEQVRFGDHIEFYTDVKFDQFLMPPLILQPIVENAIKHGLTKKQDGGTIVLRTWEDGENIKISVEDDGVGFETAELEKENSVGLKNIRYRLHHLMHGTLDIVSEVDVGTIVTITIPKKESEICI